MILKDWVLTELIAQDDTALSLLSLASLQILLIDAFALDIGNFAIKVWRLKHHLHFLTGLIVSHDDNVCLIRAMVTVIAFCEESLNGFGRRFSKQKDVLGVLLSLVRV